MNAAVIVAAGRGTRMGLERNKVLAPLCGEPVIARTVRAFERTGWFDGGIVVVTGACDLCEMKRILADAGLHAQVVLGGADRQESVCRGLAATNPAAQYVAIHDGARPFVTQKILNDCIETVRAHGSAVCALPVTDTIALCAEEKIGSIPDRSALYALQTPQAFSYAEILAAYEKIGGETFTDDSGVYAKFVAPPQIFAGDVKNKKLTFREDFLSDPLPAPRVGVGIDTHAFGKAQDHIVLGGARIPSESGLIAHSDGDVLVHAVMDALLSAAALPDIGHFFPDTDPAFADADSLRLLERVRDLLAEKRFAPRNVSAAIQAEHPRLQKYIFSMRENIARALRISPDDVGLSAGTNEGLGYVGEGKGITVTAYVSLAETD